MAQGSESSTKADSTRRIGSVPRCVPIQTHEYCNTSHCLPSRTYAPPRGQLECHPRQANLPRRQTRCPHPYRATTYLSISNSAPFSDLRKVCSDLRFMLTHPGAHGDEGEALFLKLQSILDSQHVQSCFGYLVCGYRHHRVNWSHLYGAQCCRAAPC